MTIRDMSNEQLQQAKHEAEQALFFAQLQTMTPEELLQVLAALEARDDSDRAAYPEGANS